MLSLLCLLIYMVLETISTRDQVTSSHHLMNRFHNAKVAGEATVTCWGDGTPMREFLFAEDLGEACVRSLWNNYSDYGHVNVGTGEDITIKQLAESVLQM